MTIQLDRVKPDFDDIAQQIRDGLQGKASWTALLPTDTASILIEAIAATGTFLQNGIQHTLEERFSDTAKLDSTLRAMARTQSVRLTRKKPGVVTVRLQTATGNPQVVIPRYSQFTTVKEKLFNRTSIVVPANGGFIDVPLYEGVVYSDVVTGTGQGLQTIWVEVPGFVIADEDVLVNVNGVDLTVVQDALWHYPVLEGSLSSNVVWDRTLETGELELLFGTSQFGYQPAQNDIITVTYIVCKGSLSNDPNFTGYPVQLPSNPSLIGSALSALQSGSDETPAENYRSAGRMFAAYGRAVSMSDHDAIALNYGDIVDAHFLGQRDIAPTVKEYMNVVHAYLLKSDSTQLTNTEFDTFLEWLHPKSGSLEFIKITMIPVNVTVTANIFIRSSGDIVEVKTLAEQALTSLFTPSFGYIGRNIYKSDIYDALHDCSPYIDYVQLISPTEDISCSVNVPTGLATQSLVDAGSLLTNGSTYHYAISATNAIGETFASEFVSITLPGSGGPYKVRLTWNKVEGATGYNIYGRSTSTPHRVNTSAISGTTTLFDDLGGTLGASPINEISNAYNSYAILSSKTVQVYYTSRS